MSKKAKILKKVNEQVKGITLMTLVVTIIVLLILAGVAIRLGIGNKGIIIGAENAAEMWKEGQANEQEELGDLSEFITSTTDKRSEIEKAKENGNFFEKDTTIKDDLQNEVRVPEGFKIADDSATKVEDGIVIEDNVGNQFVWIPAKTGAGATIHTTDGDKTIVYQRTAFTEEDITSDYRETLDTNEEASVNLNGGYYIGRFEAGDKVSTNLEKMRTSGNSQTNEVSIKKGQAPYVYATYDNQKSLAEGMDTAREYTGTTKMASSYAWDTAISFIQIKVPDYGTNSPQGNYKDITFNYANIGETEKTQTKEKDSNILVPTGQTTAVSNIYDMGGNCWERTTESFYGTGAPISIRGGSYINVATSTPAGYRTFDGIYSGASSSFRVTLFCSTER